jgi:hypothetical protein
MKKQALILVALFLASVSVQAQDLLSPSFSFSHKKTSYITLADGTEINGTIKDLDREKGLIEYVKIKDGAGKKHKLDAEDIKFMYLPPSGIDNLSKKLDFMTDAQKWNDDKLNQDFLSEGYTYFELADVKVKKKDRKLLMQLLNPNFSKEVKVYHDPYAKETMSVGVAGVKLAGGFAKSYYISKGGKPAFRLKKKDYKEEFLPMWNSCKDLIKEFKDPKWGDLVKHVLAFSECKG